MQHARNSHMVVRLTRETRVGLRRLSFEDMRLKRGHVELERLLAKIEVDGSVAVQADARVERFLSTRRTESMKIPWNAWVSSWG